MCEHYNAGGGEGGRGSPVTPLFCSSGATALFVRMKNCVEIDIIEPAVAAVAESRSSSSSSSSNKSNSSGNCWLQQQQ